MIPFYQLRVGNYVLVDKSMQQISLISDTYASTTPLADMQDASSETVKQHSLESLQPVPLNDDVLQHCHFVFHKYFKFWQLLTANSDNQSEMDVDTDYNVIDFMRKPVVKRVSSLHQLQNVYFMLKGKELHFQQEETAL